MRTGEDQAIQSVSFRSCIKLSLVTDRNRRRLQRGEGGIVRFIQSVKSSIRRSPTFKSRKRFINLGNCSFKRCKFLPFIISGCRSRRKGRCQSSKFLLICKFPSRPIICFRCRLDRPSVCAQRVHSGVSSLFPLRSRGLPSICHCIPRQRGSRHHGRNGHANFRLTQSARLRMVLLHSIIHKLIRENDELLHHTPDTALRPASRLTKSKIRTIEIDAKTLDFDT
ncbi:hypothetical protein PHO31112_05399 [Pandoraea horticolens]|uniref:Uncharacterized protein n=1 Tax=Pandoraea horticolens TaxID=2508298 RepID=A0A5E4ZC59_9BURK|nr:hypothetical protein PHO31112_05399 [Pandoraea horticolens]